MSIGIFFYCQISILRIFLLPLTHRNEVKSYYMIDFGTLRVEKLPDVNYHIWEQKIELILPSREVGIAVAQENMFQRDAVANTKWMQCDKMARKP